MVMLVVTQICGTAIVYKTLFKLIVILLSRLWSPLISLWRHSVLEEMVFSAELRFMYILRDFAWICLFLIKRFYIIIVHAYIYLRVKFHFWPYFPFKKVCVGDRNCVTFCDFIDVMSFLLLFPTLQWVMFQWAL